MAVELVLKNWCDPCLAADVHTPAETVNVPALFGPAFDVEVCDEHATALREAVEALRGLGRAPGRTAQPGPVRASTGNVRASDAPGTGGTCPECGRTYPTKAGIRGHLRTKHGKSLADVGLAEARFTCPECGGKFDAGPGYASHLRLVHGTTMARTEQSA